MVMMRPTRIQSACFSSVLPHPVAVAVALAAAGVEAGSKQEADAPFPVNPCACLTLAPSPPPPISPSLPRHPAPPGHRPHAVSRQVSCIHSHNNLEESALFTIYCAKKNQRAHPVSAGIRIPYLGYEKLAKGAPSPLGVSSFQFPEARPADRAPCPRPALSLCPAPPPALPPINPSIPLPHLPLACATLVTCSAHHRLTRHSIPCQHSPHLIKHAPSLEHRVLLRRSLNWHRPSPVRHTAPPPNPGTRDGSVPDADLDRTTPSPTTLLTQPW